MNELLERLRTSFDNLSEREKKLVSLMGGVLGVFVLGLPLLLMYTRNLDLQDENDALRAVLQQIELKGPQYAMLAEERRAAKARYLNQTPPLGSFLEAEATKQGITVKEFTDQPQKTVGDYLRRNVRVSFNGVELTPTVNLMSNIVGSNYPVAIEQIQIEHYQTGDKYNVKLGVLTFDKQKAAAKPAKAADEED